MCRFELFLGIKLNESSHLGQMMLYAFLHFSQSVLQPRKFISLIDYSIESNRNEAKFHTMLNTGIIIIYR